MVTSAAGIVLRDRKWRGNGFNADWCQLFFLQLWLIFYVILHVNWPVESIIKSHESSACAFENLASFYQVKKLKSIQNFRSSGKNHY